MPRSADTLRFSLANHGDAIFCKMNDLREEHRFCDVTLLLGSPNGSADRSHRFHGHRVVLAASSGFLRDQFLLHEGQAELSVGVVSSVRVAETLLLSCYTGLLEVPLKDLLSYLTAASAFQMSQVVDKCLQALSLYLTPNSYVLKLEECFDEKEDQQLYSSWPGSIFESLREKEAVQPSASVQEGGAVLIQPKLRVSQDSEDDGQEQVQIRKDRKATKTKKSSEDQAFCLDALESKTTAAVLDPPEVFQEPLSSTTVSSAVHEEVVDSPQNQHEQVAEESPAERQVDALSAQQHQGGELLKPLPGAHAEDVSDSVLIQRPYLCRRCDQIFQNLWSYVGHLKEHRQCSCLICGEIFPHKTELSHHIRAHTNFKPFKCPLCHETFTQKALLQDHLHLHTGDKPHRFTLHLTEKSGLREHQSKGRGQRNLTDVFEDGGVAG
ncbi:zinc finger and BTB domain-containing protein 26-like [Kryptolebias marmoratus]|uniref:zinc finger and BTB domain-containing protein 26-like n=1 Tax=Kryptolebias marmoratus TaxID=37003 RepID=UPI0007F87038|nr:zinc finger and BTB domain-containing protein 26-like [Kryptolebias marmoratus]